MSRPVIRSLPSSRNSAPSASVSIDAQSVPRRSVRVSKIPVAIVGSGNIGTDLMYKLLRSTVVEPRWMIGVDPQSEGLRLAARAGLEANSEGVDWLLAQTHQPVIVFEATSAYVHVRNAPRYLERGIRAVDLTPAARGPYVIPPVNLSQYVHEMNVNMVTCGGQATIPMVYAVSRIVDVDYAEIVATVASKPAGPGTRQNIDEFTRTTSNAVEGLGGAGKGKAIIILNPAEPPMLMRATIFCNLPLGADQAEIEESIVSMVADVQAYAPGYRLTADPQFDEGRVAIFIEVEGAGDYLPSYSGNLDIM